VNFDRFKSVLPKKAQIDSKDTEYLQHLNSLKEPKQNNVWAAVGTIAAAVAIVAAVTLWALIGRGLRGTDPTPALPATEDFDYIKVTQLSKEYDLTEKNLEKFENALFSHFNITSIPFFTPNSTPPADQQIADYYYTIKTELDLADFAKEYFNIDSDFKDVLPSGDTHTTDADYKVLAISEVELNDGRRTISVVYEMEDYVYTLTYFASGDTGIEVDYFWAHQKNGPSGHEGETVESEFQSIAKEYCFEQMYDFERGTLPDFSVAKYYIARIYCDRQKTSLDLHKGKNDRQVLGYPVDSYKAYMDDIFGGYELPDSVTPVGEITGPKYYDIGLVKAEDGTLFVPIENEGGGVYYYEFKSFAEGEYNGKKTITVTYDLCNAPPYEEGKTTYAVTYTTTDGIHPDKIIEKYIKNPEDSSVGTIIETGHSSYDKVTLIHATETCLAAIKEHKVVDRANENPTTKTFELDGKTLELTFKEKRPAPAAGGYVYTYTDSDEIWYGFYENKYFIDISDMGSHKKKPTVITKDEAFEIADKYARVMLGDDYENYQITVSEDFNSELYRFDFEKNYGKDGFLSGEIFGAFIYKNGRINSCSVMNKYMFEGFDPSLVAGITKADVDAALVKAYQDEGMDMSLYTPKADSYFLTNYEGKWYIGVSSVLYIGEEKKGRGDTHYFEIS